MSINAVKDIMATIFSAQNALREVAPEYKWSGLGNVLGDYGEYACIDKYNLIKAPAGSVGFDAYTEDGKTVEIKARRSKTVGFRGDADLMLVIYIADDGTFEEVYFGDFQKVKDISSYSARDNKQVTSISKLKKLRDGKLQ